MTSNFHEPSCRSIEAPISGLALSAALVTLLASTSLGADTKKAPPPPPPPAAAHPAAAPPPKLNSVFNLNNNINTPAAPQRSAPGNPAQKPPASPGNSAAGLTRAAPFNISSQKFTPGPSVQSRNFSGHPGPPGSSEAQTRNGSIVRKAADGSVLDVRNARTGVSVHHAIDGSRQITVERPDHSKVYIPSHGIAYVQHIYTFQGHPLVSRTLVVQGQLFNQIYRPYTVGNTTLDVYATSRYFAPNYYQWASSPFKTPQNFSWTYTTNAAPWYGHYRGYFTPEPAYQTPVVYLTDYMLAATLFVAYATNDESGVAPPDDSAPITPEIKQALATEVSRQISSETTEAQQNARNIEPSAASGSVIQTFSDRQQHAFVVSKALEVVDGTGRRCLMSEGDVINVMTAPNTNDNTVGAIVLSTKGGKECSRAASVQLALGDVQEMQNHMRETIDQGLANTKAAEQAQFVTPAFVDAAPPADANAASEIRQQQEIAAAAES